VKRSPLKRKKPLRSSRRPMRARKADPSKRRFAANVNEAFREWIREQPCCIPGCLSRWKNVECAHVKSRGAGGVDEGNAVPMCAGHHRYQHLIGIKAFQERMHVDLAAIAAKLGIQWVADHPQQEADNE